METFIMICGFLGGWALLTGPVYQATIELGELEVNREALGRAHSSASKPAPLSPWWWLLPPVAYVKQHRRQEAFRSAVMSALTPQERDQTRAYFEKARGWLFVAVGAFLIAVKETWELVHHLHLPGWVFWLLLVLMLVLSLGASVARQDADNRGTARRRPPRR